MSAVLTPPETTAAPIVSAPSETIAEQRFVLPNVSWATYEQLLANYQNSGSPRFTHLLEGPRSFNFCVSGI
jgi:hypothetical protein